MLADTVREAARRFGDLVAFVDPDGTQTSYADLDRRSDAVAAALVTRGVSPGDRVVLMMRNIPDFHFVDLGVAALGATAISVYNSSSPEQVAYLVGHCRAKVAVVEDDGFEERFLKVRDELPALETILNLSKDGVRDALFHGGKPIP